MSEGYEGQKHELTCFIIIGVSICVTIVLALLIMGLFTPETLDKVLTGIFVDGILYKTIFVQ